MPTLSTIALDTEKLEHGAWFKHPGGFSFRIRRDTWPAYVEGYLKRIRELRGKHGDEIPSAELRRIQAEELAAHIVTSWQDVEKDDGKPWQFSADAVREVLADPRYADLFRWIEECMAKGSAFRSKAKEVTLGK